MMAMNYILIAAVIPLSFALALGTDALGGIDAAINVAGGGVGKRTLSREGPHPLEDFKRTVDLNLVASFNLLRLEADVSWVA